MQMYPPSIPPGPICSARLAPTSGRDAVCNVLRLPLPWQIAITLVRGLALWGVLAPQDRLVGYFCCREQLLVQDELR
jgi:hypothetical protein